jgi:hypothetical protein
VAGGERYIPVAMLGERGNIQEGKLCVQRTRRVIRVSLNGLCGPAVQHMEARLIFSFYLVLDMIQCQYFNILIAVVFISCLLSSSNLQFCIFLYLTVTTLLYLSDIYIHSPYWCILICRQMMYHCICIHIGVSRYCET